MKILGKLHETLIRRIDKENPESDYYELYPICVSDNVYMTDDEDESLGEFLSKMDFKYNTFLENLKFPVNGVSVFDGKNYGPVKTGIVKLSAKDFNLDKVDNTSDSEKPVNDNHRKYIEGYINTISDQIDNILGNVSNWNKHIYDYSNPHKVTWEQVTGGSPINPNELVDEEYVKTSIDTHNQSKDLTTIHPEILSQISVLQSKIDHLTKIIENLENSSDSIIANVTKEAVGSHNRSPESHPNLIARLNQLSLDITAAIEQYSGMTGMEFVSNRIDRLELKKMNDRWDESYNGKYPSVNAIKDLMRDMEFNVFTKVDYFENISTNEMNQVMKDNITGIIFADKFNGVSGAHIFVYSNRLILAKYDLPGPAPSVTIDHVSTAPTKSEMENKYGSNSAIVLSDKSSSSPAHQSIIMWNNYTYYEYIINTLSVGEHGNIYGADYAVTNDGYDFSKFTTGHGVLFVSNLSRSNQPGVVIYNKGGNPETQEINYGISAIDGLSIEKHTFEWTGSGNETIQLTNKYLEPPTALCVLEGFDLRDSTEQTLTLDAKVVSIDKTSTTITYNITTGVVSKYSVFVVGKPSAI